MISAELVHLIRQLLHPLQRNVWNSIYVTDSYNSTLNTAIQLDEEDYTSLMLSTGIMTQKGANKIISLQHLEFLQAALQENMTLYITKAYIANKNQYCLSINRPTYHSPARELKDNPRIIINRGGNQLDAGSRLLLGNLLHEVTDSESEDDELNANYYYYEEPDQAAEPMILDDEDNVATANEEANEQRA